MSSRQRKQQSSLSFSQRARNPAAGSSAARSSGRQIKTASQGFHFGDARQDDREVERVEKEAARERKRREQRLEELERGSGPSSRWNDNSSLNVPSASTSAAAIAGLLAGRQAEQEGGFEDDAIAKPHASTAKRKQSADLKRLLTQRRSLKLLLEDASASPVLKSATNNFVQSLQVAHRYPVHRGTGPVCSVCGYWGDIRCVRCHDRVCSLKCSTTHNETRCERPL